jgi:hypothetical protein
LARDVSDKRQLCGVAVVDAGIQGFRHLRQGVAVKRLLVVTGLLSLAAILLIPSAGSAQSTLVQIVRTNPRQVTLTVRPRRDRTRPYTFTSTGRIVPPRRYCTPTENPFTTGCVPIFCPPGVTDVRYCLLPGLGVLCTGTVTVRFQKRSTTISSRVVSVRPDCTYRSRVTFHTRLFTRVGTLRVQARFGGNAVLLPRRSPKRTVRAG